MAKNKFADYLKVENELNINSIQHIENSLGIRLLDGKMPKKIPKGKFDYIHCSIVEDVKGLVNSVVIDTDYLKEVMLRIHFIEEYGTFNKVETNFDQIKLYGHCLTAESFPYEVMIDVTDDLVRFETKYAFGSMFGGIDSKGMYRCLDSGYSWSAEVVTSDDEKRRNVVATCNNGILSEKTSDETYNLLIAEDDDWFNVNPVFHNRRRTNFYSTGVVLEAVEEEFADEASSSYSVGAGGHNGAYYPVTEPEYDKAIESWSTAHDLFTLHNNPYLIRSLMPKKSKGDK